MSRVHLSIFLSTFIHYKLQFLLGGKFVEIISPIDSVILSPISNQYLFKSTDLTAIFLLIIYFESKYFLQLFINFLF